MISEIYNEDCMQLMARYPDKYFDLAVVDPPYGLGLSVVNSGGRFKRYHNKNGNWDYETPNEAYFEQLFRILKEQVIWGGNYFNLPANKCFFIWDKMQPQGISFAMCEYAWVSFNNVAQIFRLRTQGQENRFHPTQKPVALYDWIFANYAKPGQIILDTHLGSGSSRIAADKAGLNFVGCELDADYFAAHEKRWNEYKLQLKLL